MGGKEFCLCFFSPNGLFDPLMCRNSRWIIVAAAITDCIRKCYAKNPGRVALSIANSPHTH